MDLFAKCRAFTSAQEAIAGGYYPYFVPFENADGATAYHDRREIVMAGSNSYLGLTKDPRVLAASRAALEASGSSVTGSRLLNGNLELHEQLEEELADFLGKPAALVFSTGYGANLGVISALVGRHDEVVLDREAHASSIDGAQASRARMRFFAHNDVADLRRRLASGDPSTGRLVVVDGVYSMAGDLCPLPEIVAACEEHGARLVVDDAHGAGVVGGAHGTSAHFGLTDRVDLITVTFSKSFASIGGAVAGDDDVIHYLRHHARSEIFSASMTPANTAAALAAVRIARNEPWRAQFAMENARYVADALLDLGLDVGETDSPIVPIHTGNVITTVMLWTRLMELGVYINAVLPPAASPRLRASLTAAHRQSHLDRVVEAFRIARDEGLTGIPDGSAA
jgi:8-amino-7-oxononanoate synthase